MTKANKGFTLVEVMISMAVLLGLVLGVMGLFVYSTDLQETAANTTLALNAARAKLEEIKGTALTHFDQVAGYNGQEAEVNGLNGRMHIYATKAKKAGGATEEDDLMDIRIVVGWSQKGGRIVGEGKLDGSGKFTFNDASPYGNGNGVFNSPVEFTFAVANRGG